MSDAQQRKIAQLRALLNDPQASVSDLTDCYVQVLGPQLLDLARSGAKQFGRGAIEIDLRGIDLRTATGNGPITYYPQADATDEWPAETLEVLQSYQIGREAVVVLFHDRSDPLLYVLE